MAAGHSVKRTPAERSRERRQATGPKPPRALAGGGPRSPARAMTADEIAAFWARMNVVVHLVDLRAELHEHRRRFRHESLALDAVHIAKERGDVDGLKEIETVCRRVLDRAWRPTVVTDPESDATWEAEQPLELRAAEAHRLFGHVLRYALVAVASVARGDGDNGTAWRAVERLVVVLQTHAAHFPGGDVDAVLTAMADCARNYDAEAPLPIARVLGAWGASKTVCAHVAKTNSRQK